MVMIFVIVLMVVMMVMMMTTMTTTKTMLMMTMTMLPLSEFQWCYASSSVMISYVYYSPVVQMAVGFMYQGMC